MPAARSTPEPAERAWNIAWWTVNSVLVAIGALATWFFVERRSGDYDPQYARDIAERTLRMGGSYYSNGIHNKGPLEIWIPSMVRRLFGFDAFWFGIALVIMAVAVIAGWAGARVVRALDGPGWLAWAAGACIVVHFTISGTDYAGVLYSRNMTVGAFALALVALLGGRASSEDLVEPTAWSRRRDLAAAAVAGAAIGLAVQTLVSSAIVGVCLCVYALVGEGRCGWGARSVRRGWVVVAAAAVVFVSAPLYYRIFGPWDDFWGGWWVYPRYMSESTGRSLANQIGLGWHNFYEYSRSHAPAVGAIVAFVAAGVARRGRLTRRQRHLHVVLVAWWLGAWAEIVVAQRYSSHYYSVVAFPTALMIAGVAVHIVAILREANYTVRSGLLVPHVAVAVSLVWAGTTPMREGLQAARSFPGVHALATQRAQGRAGETRAVQAVLELTSRPDDPVQVWTERPWWYLIFRRVSATRFIWKSFLMGETYLGRTSEDYVLPGSWERWARDIERADPHVYLVDRDSPLPGTTPADELWAERFVAVLTTVELDVAVETATWTELTSPEAMTALDLTAPGVERTGSSVKLGPRACTRLDLRVDPANEVRIGFGAAGDEVVIARGSVVTRSPRVEYMRADALVPERIRIVVGTTSALVVFDDRIVAGLAYLDRPEVTIDAGGAAVDLESGVLGGSGECATPVGR